MKIIITITIYLICLFLFSSVIYGVCAQEWFSSPTDLQKEIFVDGFLWCFFLIFLIVSTCDLVSLLPWDKIRQKIFKCKSPVSVDPEQSDNS